MPRNTDVPCEETLQFLQAIFSLSCFWLMVRFFVPNVGVDGLRNMFALDEIYTIIRVYKNIHLTMDRRGGL